MPEFNLLANLLIVLFSAFLGGLISKKLKQPIMFGYLFAGLVVSGLAGKLGLERKSLSLLAEIGLAFLMFTLGLEFSLKKIESIKKIAIRGASLQIFFVIFLGTVLLQQVFKFDFSAAFIMACAFSLSSTAVVVKILTEKSQLETLPGEIMVGWLLIQDLAVLPLIALIPIIFSQETLQQNLIKLGGSVVVLLATWVIAKKYISRFTDFVASFKSRELLIIFVVFLVFTTGLLTSSLGFSFGLGAFLAGLILNQATSHFAIFSEIRPLRDVFLAVFFVSLGLSLEPSFLLSNVVLIFSVSFVVLLLKILLVSFIVASFRYHAKTIFDCGFGLPQVGEFSFVLAAVALSGGFLAKNEYSLIVSVTLFTMFLTPWLFNFSQYFYKKVSKMAESTPTLYKKYFAQQDRIFPLEELPFENHVVILGYGRVGRWIGAVLKKANIRFLVVEYDPEIVRRLKLENEPVIFGDPADISVLDFAQVDKARMVVLAIPDPLTQKMIISNCQTLNPRAQIICRSHNDNNHDLKAMGIKHVVHPEFEAALSISHRALQHYGLGKEDLLKHIKQTRQEYESIT